ncbi:MAG TPA: acetate/propionate family kinase [Phycisphaerae bacterium]|nr:acetate/propionate family kinase [Phycisphaerae bacterium]
MIDQLRSHPLFSSLPPEALARAAEAGRAVRYVPGEICIGEGEAGEVFGVLLSGGLSAVRGRGKASEERVGVISPGECFGEMSLLTGSPSGVSVVATEPSEAIVFSAEAIGPVLTESMEAVRFLSRMMQLRLMGSRGRGAAERPRALRYSLGANRPMRILTISCRQDDLRYAFFDTSGERPHAWGHVAGLDTAEATHVHHGPSGRSEHRLGRADHRAAAEAALEAMAAADGGVIASPEDLSAIAHQVCHGGPRFNGPVVVDEDILAEIARLACLAPMDNPWNVRGIEACRALAPGAVQVAVFDTAFHRAMPEAARCYALGADLADDPALRRYGAHGVSHEGAARSAAAQLGMSFEAVKIVSIHLGRGASLTAIDHGRSIDCTTGLSPLDGPVSATRCGDLDPGAMLYLIRQKGIDPEDLSRRLYTESGLLGLSGVSGDVLEVLAAAEADDPRALLALQVYCRSVRRHLAGQLGLLGGADAIVFTGGVGANAPGIRARICQELGWAGIRLDEARNRAARVAWGEVAEISDGHTRCRVLAAGENEAHTLARQAVRAVAQQRITEVIRRHPKPIPIGISVHHVHLSDAHVEALFGPGAALTPEAELRQPGQFASAQRVALIGPRGRIERVRVLGPTRPRTQVEITRTEEFRLGIDAPIRMSGDLDGTPGLTLEGPAGTVELDGGVICAMRHIHMSPADAMELAVRDRDIVRVRVAGERELIFGSVAVRVGANYRLDMHIDTDEANAAELAGGAVGYLDSIQERATGL